MLRVAEEKLSKLPEESIFTNEKVTASDIAQVVSKWTGIPVDKEGIPVEFGVRSMCNKF